MITTSAVLIVAAGVAESFDRLEIRIARPDPVEMTLGRPVSA